MNDNSNNPILRLWRWHGRIAGLVCIALALAVVTFAAPGFSGSDSGALTDTPASALQWSDLITGSVLLSSLILLSLSAFFSGSEVAFFSIHTVRLRAMSESSELLERLVAQLMEHPGKLLTTILMGNSIVNILLSIVLAARIEELFAKAWLPPTVAHPIVSYAIAVTVCTGLLVMCGEVTPKLVVVRNAEFFARCAVIPLSMVDWLLSPIRGGLIRFVGFLFRITRFSEVPVAPFITDDEFKSILSDSEVTDMIAEEERQMIRGILEFSDVMVREILVPRPDIAALKENATVREALAMVREFEYARMPVYRDDLDHITGILYAKDLLAIVERGDLEKSVAPMVRKVHFVPETMVVADFVKMAQRLRTHMAIAVDEYGGTSGLVTLQDALREVVGDIGDDEEPEAPLYQKLSDNDYHLDGGFPLSELEQLTGRVVEDEEHTTVAGFVMDHTGELSKIGDVVEHNGLRFTVEAMEGKRMSRLRLQILPPDSQSNLDRLGGNRR